MKNLKNISKHEFLHFLDSFDYVFFDVDGVLQLSKQTIPGSDHCVAKLRTLGKKIAIVSNNSALPKNMSVLQLKDFKVTEEEVTTASEPAANYLKKINFDKDIFLISGQNTKDILKGAGFNVVQKEAATISEESFTALADDCIETIKEFPNIGAVIVDPDINMSMVKMSRAVSLLNHYKDAIFLYGAADESLPVSKENLILGLSFAIEAIKQLTNKKSVSYAKPSKLLADHLNEKYNITDPKKVLFVGDNLAIDIGFGAIAGYQTLLVLSGQTNDDQIEKLEKDDSYTIKPDFYANNLKSFNDLLEKYCCK